MAMILGAMLLSRDPATMLAKGKGKARAEAKTKRKPCYPGGTTCAFPARARTRPGATSLHRRHSSKRTSAAPI